MWLHQDGSVLVTYVDDLRLAAVDDAQTHHWTALDDAIEFKESPSEIGQFVGARYRFSAYDPRSHDAPRTMLIDMCSYVKAMVKRFSDESGLRLGGKAETPYISDELWGSAEAAAGKYAANCASYAATVLFVARVARPDLSNATQRFCSAVARWTKIHDAALVRLMSYAQRTADLVVEGTLSPADFADVAIHLYTDADWNGDPATTKSTNGWWCELFAEGSGRSWPLCWGAGLQTCTSSATAEAETVAASHGLRKEAFPIQLLLEEIIGRRVAIVHHVDNL